MGNNNIQLNIPGSKILSAITITLAAVLAFAGILTLANAAALNDDHFQDANGVNTIVTNQVVRKGWGYIQGNGNFAIEDIPINYGITFDDLPFLIVKFANSRQVSDGNPTDISQCEITRKVISAGVNQTTGGFKPVLRTTDNNGFPSATNYCYTWIAIGKHDASYSAGGGGAVVTYTGHVRTLATGNRYVTPSGETTDQSSYEYSASLMASSCKAKNLYVKLLNNTPADITAVRFVKNSGPTMITCTIGAGGSDCNDTVNTESLAPGDEIALAVSTGTFTAGSTAELAFAWTCEHQ